MDRIALYILVSILLVCAESCTGTTAKNKTNEEPVKCILQLGEICIDAKDTAEGATLTIAVGLLTKIDGKLFQQAVDKVLETYHQNPKTTATVGILLSMAILKDSNNDYERIAIYDQQILNALEYKDENSRLKTLQSIKMLLIADQKRQFTMVVIKGLVTLACGYISYSTIGSRLFWPMTGTTAFSGLGTIVNAYNYQQFSTLITKLKQDGHLD
jgi:hypothetical protein